MRKFNKISLPAKRMCAIAALILLAACSLLPTADDTSITPTLPSPASEIQFTPTPQVDPQEMEAVIQALREAVQRNEKTLAFLIYQIAIDHVDFSPDNKLALVWLTLLDTETNQPIPAEAGLAIARKTKQDGKTTWKVTLQADSNWSEALEAVPESMLSGDLRSRYTSKTQSVSKDAKVYSGYRLPWQQGLAKRVTGSIGHVLTYKSCPKDCLYAFDFADGTMFPILAAKSGTVKYAVWHWPNGNTEHSNFLVLEDTNTTPTTYQVYLHLAQDSIPVELRKAGVRVLQGQYIGKADDTGPSTGHHLHFHVHTNPTSYWGTSVDITFDDVAINGGRPRTCGEAAQFPGYGVQCQSGNLFVSGNGDTLPPTAKIVEPAVGQTITGSSMVIAGTASDDYGVAAIQAMYTYDGTWHPIGNIMTTSPFAITVNLCEAGIPNGKFFIAVQVTDKAGRVSDGYPGMRELTKKYNCPLPPPACPPGENQIGIYTEANYQGSCDTLNVGQYANSTKFGKLSGQTVRSIQVGEEAMAVLYSAIGYGGKQQVLTESDADLSDNSGGVTNPASISVQLRPAAPDPVTLNAPRNAQNQPPKEGDSLTLTWDAGANSSLEFSSELSSTAGYYKTLDWQYLRTWSVGALPAGNYTWIVWARNSVGESQATLQFSVSTAEASPAASALEALDAESPSSAILLKWTAQPNKAQIDHFEIQYSVDDGTWQDWNKALPGSLRKAWFIGQLGKKYSFRLRSVDANQKVEAYPDQAETSTQITAACQPDEFEGSGQNNDNAFTNATPLDPGEAQVHNFCGENDEDWIVFLGQAGVTYRFTAEPGSNSSAASVLLYDMNDYTLLGQQIPTELGQLAALEWTAPSDGFYYLRLGPIDPHLAGTDIQYQVRIDQIGQVSVPGMVCTSALLPVIWVIIKKLWAYKKKLEQTV